MTKNFCDKCKLEINGNKHIKVSLSGFTEKLGYLYEDVSFCEKCYLKMYKQIHKLIPIKPTMSKISLPSKIIR